MDAERAFSSMLVEASSLQRTAFALFGILARENTAHGDEMYPLFGPMRWSIMINHTFLSKDSHLDRVGSTLPFRLLVTVYQDPFILLDSSVRLEIVPMLEQWHCSHCSHLPPFQYLYPMAERIQSEPVVRCKFDTFDSQCQSIQA